MKKLLNISVIAALAVLPMAANADPATGTEQTPAITTENAPLYQGKAADQDNDGKLATAGYVKGAYNDAIKAVNKVHTAAQAAITDINTNKIGNMSDLEGDEDTLVEAINAVRTAASNASSSANSSYTNTTSGLTATNVQNAIDEVEGRLDTAESDIDAVEGRLDTAESDIDALEDTMGSETLTTTSQTVTGAINELDGAVGDNADAIAILNGSASTNGSVAKAVADAMATAATQDGVTETISQSAITGTVPVVNNWSTGATGTVAISANITGHSYVEPEEEEPEPANP